MLVANKVFATNKVNSVEDGDESIEKCGKSSKTGKSSKLEKSKSEKMSKFWNLPKSGKNLSKNKNLTNSDATEDRPKFLTLDARTAFNHLRLAFTKALIFRHFDPEYYIWIETDTLSYTIGGILS